MTALGVCSRPDDFDPDPAGCVEPAGVSESHDQFAGRTKMMFRGHRRSILPGLCPTVVLS